LNVHKDCGALLLCPQTLSGRGALEQEEVSAYVHEECMWQLHFVRPSLPSGHGYIKPFSVHNVLCLSSDYTTFMAKS